MAADFLTGSVRRAATGQMVVDCDLAFEALNAPANPLTPRELDALRLAAEGASTAEIARNRVDAIRIAQDAGWF
jgi:two-component system, NarL family, response regulator DesR